MPVRKDCDTKAELNRRGQAFELLAGTGISRRVRMVEHQGIALCIPAWKAGVYLSTLMPVWNCGQVGEPGVVI
jgi:hypothetical protein